MKSFEQLISELNKNTSKYLDDILPEGTDHNVQVHWNFDLAEEVYNDMGTQTIYIHQYPCQYKYAITTSKDPLNNPNDYTIVVEDKTFDKIVLSEAIKIVLYHLLDSDPRFTYGS